MDSQWDCVAFGLTMLAFPKSSMQHGVCTWSLLWFPEKFPLVELHFLNLDNMLAAVISVCFLFPFSSPSVLRYIYI